MLAHLERYRYDSHNRICMELFQADQTLCGFFYLPLLGVYGNAEAAEKHNRAIIAVFRETKVADQVREERLGVETFNVALVFALKCYWLRLLGRRSALRELLRSMGRWTWEKKGSLGLTGGAGAVLPAFATPPTALPVL